VNSGGGLLGRRVELQLVDDASEAAAAGKLYERLILEHKVDLLIGPFGSAASLGAAAAAERNRRVMINATGSARTVHRSGFRYVFQTVAPLSAYGAGALDLARSLGLKRIMLLAREDPGSREIAARLREDAAAAGSPRARSRSTGREARISRRRWRARGRGRRGWIAFGLPQDAAEMVKSLRALRFAPRLFVAQGAADPEFIKRVGQDAEYAVGITPYERRAATRGNAQFVQDYVKKWSAEPGPLAAEAMPRPRFSRRRCGAPAPWTRKSCARRLRPWRPKRRSAPTRGAIRRAGRGAAAAGADRPRAARDHLARGARDGEVAAVSRVGRAQAGQMSAATRAAPRARIGA